MNKKIYIGIPILLLCSIIFAWIKTGTFIGQLGDTGQNSAILHYLYYDNKAFNPFLSTIYQYSFVDQLYTKDPGFFCNTNFSQIELFLKNSDHLHFHTYFIAYIIAPFVSMFDARYVLQLFNAISFFGLLYIVWLKTERNLILKFLTILCVLFYPGWSLSILGQPYFDRFYLFLGAAFVFALFDSKSKFYSICFLSLLSGAIVEKAIFYNGIILIVSGVLFYNEWPKRKGLFAIAWGVALIVIFNLILKFYLQNPYYTTSIPSSIGAFLDPFLTEGKRKDIYIFLLSFAPFVILLPFFSLKLFLLVAVIISPNIFGTIGGAEKTGFYTHYHALYVPVIIFVFLFVVNRMRTKNAVIYSAAVLIYYLIVNFSNGSQLRFGSPNSFIVGVNELVATRQTASRVNKMIADNVGENSKLTLSEFAMPYTFNNKKSTFFPYGLEDSDYAVIVTKRVENEYLPNLLTFLGDEHNTAVGKCLKNKMIENGYDFENPVDIGYGAYIFKRK